MFLIYLQFGGKFTSSQGSWKFFILFIFVWASCILPFKVGKSADKQLFNSLISENIFLQCC